MDGELLKESAVMLLHSGRFKTHLRPPEGAKCKGVVIEKKEQF